MCILFAINKIKHDINKNSNEISGIELSEQVEEKYLLPSHWEKLGKLNIPTQPWKSLESSRACDYYLNI